MYKNATAFFVILLLNLNLFARVPMNESEISETKAAMRLEIQSLYQSYETLYAPREWKAEYLGVDLDQLFKDAEYAIDALEVPTALEFQKIVAKTLNSLNDYHVLKSFALTGFASLPLQVVWVEDGNGKAIISNGLTALRLPNLRDGDELVSISGENTADWIKKQAEMESHGNPSTDRALAAISLTARTSLWETLPEGDALLEIRSQIDGQIKMITLRWNTLPDLVKFSPEIETNWGPFKPAQFYSPVALEAIERTAASKLSLPPIGYRSSRIAPLGELVWKSPENSFFDAAIYRTPGNKRAGVIRIATFSVEEQNFFELEHVIAIMNRHTDLLVIDQMDNPGGSSFFLYGALALLTDKPLPIPLHRTMLFTDDVLEAYVAMQSFTSSFEDFKAGFGVDSIYGMRVDQDWYEGFKTFYSDQIADWEAGNRLTRPTPLSGTDKIKPHPTVRYTKPLYVLTNPLDFSCADFFPGILQDSGRATIIGTKTSGAGGAIISQKFASQFGLKGTTFTATIAYRTNGEPLENLGVTPDIELSVTAEDLQNGYTHFRDELLKIIE